MSVHVSSWVWKHSRASGNDLLVMVALADIANDEGMCWPSVKFVATRCKISTDTVRRIVHRLRDDGEISIQEQRNANGHQASNIYYFDEYIVTLQTSILPGVGGTAVQGLRARHNGGTVKEPLGAAKRDFKSDEIQKLWEEFQQHRKQMRKTLTDVARSRALKKLYQMGEARARVALQYTLENGYQGIIEPKAARATKRNTEVRMPEDAAIAAKEAEKMQQRSIEESEQ